MEKVFCSKCGTGFDVQSDTVFCSKCGAKLNRDDTPVPVETAPRNTTSNASSTSSTPTPSRAVRPLDEGLPARRGISVGLILRILLMLVCGVIAALAIIPGSCLLSRSNWESTARTDLQERLDAIDELKDYKVHVGKVELIKTSKNTYDGVATIFPQTANMPPLGFLKFSLTTERERYMLQIDLLSLAALLLNLSSAEDYGNDKAVIANSANERKLDPRLVNKKNEMWIGSISRSLYQYIFHSDGRYFHSFFMFFGRKCENEDDEDCDIITEESGMWFTTGNGLFMLSNNELTKYSYKFSNNGNLSISVWGGDNYVDFHVELKK